MKPFTISFIRDLEKQVYIGEISHSRMVEILNEIAENFYNRYSDCCSEDIILDDQSKKICNGCGQRI